MRAAKGEMRVRARGTPWNQAKRRLKRVYLDAYLGVLAKFCWDVPESKWPADDPSQLQNEKGHRHSLGELANWCPLWQVQLTQCHNRFCWWRVARRNGLRPVINTQGESNGFAKLTEAQVIQIKKLLAIGHLTQKGIGSQFNISKSTVQDIKLGRRWSHVVLYNPDKDVAA